MLKLSKEGIQDNVLENGAIVAAKLERLAKEEADEELRKELGCSKTM